MQIAAEKYHPCSYMEQTISGKINVKHLVQTTAHAIVKHQPKTENANGLIIVAIASTNMLEAKKVKKTKLTQHKISLYFSINCI